MTTNGIPNNQFLGRYISDGKVDYQQLKTCPWVQQALREIENTEIDNFTRNEQLAFWLNAYNITVLGAVIRLLERKPHWPGVTTQRQRFYFFICNRYKIANRKLSLYSLENRIIRKFGDPRIHFALNCASGSCPYLPEALFEGSTLDRQLDQLTSTFINEQNGVSLNGEKLQLSALFSMYKSDFGKNERELKAFIGNYWKGEKITPDIPIDYQAFDWRLNRAQ